MAAVRATVANFDAFMKEVYPDIRVMSMAKKNRQLLNWITRKDEFYGDALIVPILHEDPQSAGLTVLLNAVTNAETTKQKKFVITERKTAYGEVQVEAELIKAASKDAGSFLKAKGAQIDGMIRQMGKQLHLAMYRSGSGSIGRAKTITADNPSAGKSRILLYNKSDVYNFGIGQVLEPNDTDNGTTPKTNAEIVKVEALDRGNGYVFVDKDVINDMTTTAWANDDYLFPKGNYSGVVKGLAGWLPLTAPVSGDSFFTVDRSDDVEALSGHRVNQVGRSLLSNCEELAMLIGEFGGEPDTLFLNPRAGQQLAEEVGALVTRKDGGRVRVGFSGFTLENFVTGPVDVRFDIGCPPDLGFMLQRDTWTLATMGEVPHIIRDDNLSALRDSAGNYDGIAVRSRYWCEMYCKAPGKNGTLAIATA